LTAGQIEIACTLLGDANLDGKVNGADFTLMAAHFNDSVTNGWDEGDFNYSGAVNGADFVLQSNNFNQLASNALITGSAAVTSSTAAVTSSPAAPAPQTSKAHKTQPSKRRH
jgi:hypothetical protein